MVPSDWYEITRTGLTILYQPSFEQWEQTGYEWATVLSSIPFIIGDYMLYGEQAFGERASNVMELFGLENIGTVSNYKSVCKRVPPENRNPKLSFSHHRAVAHLPSGEQTDALARAEKDELTSKDLDHYAHHGRLPGLIDKVRKVKGEVETWYLMSGGRVDEGIRRVLDELKKMEDKLG
jgi:hypothetical protein